MLAAAYLGYRCVTNEADHSATALNDDINQLLLHGLEKWRKTIRKNLCF